MNWSKAGKNLFEWQPNNALIIVIIDGTKITSIKEAI